MPTDLPASVDRWLRLVKVDFEPEHRQPAMGLVMAATAVALAGSLIADVILAKIGEAVFPATKGYVHFRFSDYAKLTIIGVIIACVAWPIVTRISSGPRWLFFRQAIAVTLVLFLPDLYLLYKGQPADAVAVLMVMHVAIALVTYNALVHIAKVRPAVTSRRHAAHAGQRARGRGTRYEDYEDYGREDGYGREGYLSEDRYLEPAGGYYSGYREPDDPYQASYREPEPRYQASYREPEPRYQASYREPEPRYKASYREPELRYQASYREPDDPYEAYYRKSPNPYEDRPR